MLQSGAKLLALLINKATLAAQAVPRLQPQTQKKNYFGLSLPKNVICTCVPVCALGDTVAAGTVPDVSINLCVDVLSTFKLSLAKAWSLLSIGSTLKNYA